MTNNKQQTAVEWIRHQIKQQGVSHYFTTMEILDRAEKMEKKQSNAKINIAIKEFETLKSKANSLKDVVYLDGVLAVLDSIKNETYGGDEQ